MPYDFPGDYRIRFDSVDVGTFRNLKFPLTEPPPPPSLDRWHSGPGTIEIHDLTGVDVRGSALLSLWQKATSPAGGPPKTMTIEALDRGRSGFRWQLRAARPVKWVMKPIRTTGVMPSAGARPTVEALTIAHEGMLPAR